MCLHLGVDEPLSDSGGVFLSLLKNVDFLIVQVVRSLNMIIISVQTEEKPRREGPELGVLCKSLLLKRNIRVYLFKSPTGLQKR